MTTVTSSGAKSFAFAVVLSLAMVSSGYAQSTSIMSMPTDVMRISLDSVPFGATFWFASTFNTNRVGFGPPLPYNPFSGNTNVPIYRWVARSNSYVVGDTVLPEEEREQWLREHSTGSEMTIGNEAFSAAGLGGEMSGDSLFADYGTNLWLEIPSTSNGVANVILHNVTQGEVYELMSSPVLPGAKWNPEQALFTITNQDWIATTVPMLDRTNALLFWARDWTGIDDNTNSMPDWWDWQNYGPPMALDETLHTMTNTALSVFLRATHPEGLPLTYVILSGPTNGTLSGTPPDLVYTPATGYDGADAIVFKVTDGAFDSRTATVTISVDTAIQFLISSAPKYVSSAPVPFQLSVTSGVPRQFATLIDSTNFAGANWQAYTSSNITVTTTEGWLELWIGLRGASDNSPQVWRWTRFKLDQTAPQLSITNPVGNVVTQPLVQVQGFCPEPLASISYDLTNAAGVITNQPVLVLDQWFDTNVWEFTTNFLQALDVPLTNGLNTLTLHATDLAGNSTNLVLNLTLDYSSRTNPPVVRIYWPQDGAQISPSGGYACRGWVDDFTAMVTANVTDANGNVSPFNALVERDGKFWIQNLDLSSGTNTIQITVQDAAGNTTTTNFTVSAGPVQVAVSQFQAFDFSPNMAPTQVWGSIGSTNYAVWVNGVRAQLDGYGGWTATNVPVAAGGTRLFQARAIPNSDNGGNGSGSASFSADGSNSGNPASSQATDAELQQERPFSSYLAKYDYGDSETLFSLRQQTCGSDGALNFSLQDDDSWNTTFKYEDSAPNHYNQVINSDHFYYGPETQGQTNETLGYCAYDYLWNNWDYRRLNGHFRRRLHRYWN